MSKGIAGAVNSVAAAGSFMGSASQDRFVRLHSTFGPPGRPGQQQAQKGEVLDKSYVNVVPTVIVWDGSIESTSRSVGQDDGEGEGEDDVWDAMQEADSDSETGEKFRRRKEKKLEAH